MHVSEPAAVAGGSAQREYERRAGPREDQIRSAHPRLGGLMLALSNEPVQTRVWAQGARGERVVAAKLSELEGAHVVVLNDRRMIRSDGRSTRANIDHLVIAAAGVWVVDAKAHQGSLRVRRSGGLLSPRVEKLYIKGRDQTRLLEGLAAQVRAVREVLSGVQADVRVRGALCFVGTDLPLFGETIGNVPLVGPRGLAKLMRREGDLEAPDRKALAAYLGRRFIPA